MNCRGSRECRSLYTLALDAEIVVAELAICNWSFGTAFLYLLAAVAVEVSLGVQFEGQFLLKGQRMSGGAI